MVPTLQKVHTAARIELAIRTGTLVIAKLALQQRKLRQRPKGPCAYLSGGGPTLHAFRRPVSYVKQREKTQPAKPALMQKRGGVTVASIRARENPRTVRKAATFAPRSCFGNLSGPRRPGRGHSRIHQDASNASMHPHMLGKMKKGARARNGRLPGKGPCATSHSKKEPAHSSRSHISRPISVTEAWAPLMRWIPASAGCGFPLEKNPSGTP